MRSLSFGGSLWVALLLAAGGWALVRSAQSERTASAPTEDERDYLAAAANLARHGVLSSAPPGSAAPIPDAYREPGYPALLALTWRLAGVSPPVSASEIEGAWRRRDLAQSVWALHRLLWAATAATTGLAVARLGGGTAGALAFALVASSPALGASAALVAAENLAAPLWVAASGALAIASRRGTRAVLLAAALVGIVPLVRASGWIALPAGALLFAMSGRLPPGERARRALLFLAVGVLPTLVWSVRNARQTGYLILTDRGGQVLATRAELDAQVVREGLLPALVAWTPSYAVREWAGARLPTASFDRYAWSGEGNFFTRNLRAWRAARAGSGDPLGVDRQFGRAALKSFVARPGAHLEATVAVAWRGLFAERSPAWTKPLDGELAFVVGLLLAAATIGILGSALARRDAEWTAFLLPSCALFALHALATEFLPRFALPALPIAWAAFAVALAGSEGIGLLRRRPSPTPSR